MIEHYINGKSSGIITPDTPEERQRGHNLLKLWNAHMERNLKMTFKKVNHDNQSHNI